MKVLLIVDLQLDFLPGGKLPVPNGDRVIEPIKAIAKRFRGNPLSSITENYVVFSRDWHPRRTKHFDTWPVHCVQYTAGAAFPDNVHDNDPIISKGGDPNSDDYSATDGFVERSNVCFDEFFSFPGQVDFFVAGLATDVCVKATVLSLLEKGFTTYVLSDCIAGLTDDGVMEAIYEMTRAGAKFIKSTKVEL